MKGLKTMAMILLIAALPAINSCKITTTSSSQSTTTTSEGVETDSEVEISFGSGKEFSSEHLKDLQTQPIKIDASRKYTSNEEKARFYYTLSKQYSPDAFHILSYERKAKNFVQYASGNSYEDLIGDYGVVVHESCHHYHFFAADFSGNSYLINKDITIKVPTTEVVNANILNQVVPKAWQKEVFRYNTYIGNGSSITSQKEAIYGMLDEFASYYHGCKAQIALKEEFAKNCGTQSSKCAISYITNPASEMTAYYEFRLFMAWYLEYVEKKHPSVYQGIMENQAFKVAYTLLDDAYIELWKQYKQSRQEIIAELNKNGHKVEMKNNYIYTYDASGGYHGVGIFTKEAEYLQGLFTPENRRQLGLLRVEGVNQDNYQDFLK